MTNAKQSALITPPLPVIDITLPAEVHDVLVATHRLLMKFHMSQDKKVLAVVLPLRSDLCFESSMK